MDSELYEERQQIQIQSVIKAMNRIATSLEKIETTLDKGLINDFTENPHLWEIYQALHLNRDEKFPNSMTEISNSLKSIAENWE